MIKKFIIAVLICGVLWAIIQQLNHIPPRLKLKLTAMAGKKFIPYVNKQPKNAVSKEMFSSSDAAWSGREFIISTKITIEIKGNTSKQQRQSENESDVSTEPDEVHCPLVEKIQKTAQQINQAFLSRGSYGITSLNPVFQDGNLDWLVGAVGIVAGSSDEAIYKAGIATSKTNIRKNEYAEKLDKSVRSHGLHAFFVCYYGPGDIIAIGVWNKMFIDK